MAETVPKESLISSVLKGDHSSSSSSSSSSDSDTEDRNGGVKEIIKTKVFRLFGRERPVHHVLGGGQSRVKQNLLFLSFCSSIGWLFWGQFQLIDNFSQLIDLQFRMFFYGGTRRSLEESSVSPLWSGFYSRWLSTIFWHSSAIAWCRSCRSSSSGSKSLHLSASMLFFNIG